MSKEKHRKTPEISLESSLSIKDWQAILAMTLAILFFFRDIILQKAYFWEDFLYYYYPVRNFASVSLAHGELPLWNPYTFNGMPFQADIQSALFYIPNLFLTLFASGERLNFFWLEMQIVLHYILAAVSMYYLVKSLNLNKLVALFSGMVYALSGYFITHAIHQPMICESAWLPLIILLFRQTLHNRSITSMILTGLVLGHTILAGFPQLTLYIFFFLFLYFLFEIFITIKDTSIRDSLPLIPFAAGSVIIALGFSTIQLLPTMELAPFSQRADITYAKSISGSLSWSGMVTLLVPKFFGSQGAQGSSIWIEGSYGQYWETCVYLGIAPLVLLLFAATLVRRNCIVAFLVGIILFSLLYALGDGFILHKLFFDYIPGFSKFRDPGRMSFLFTFAASIMAGFGLQMIISHSINEKKFFQRTLIVIACGGVLVWGFIQAGFLQPSERVQYYQRVHTFVTGESTTMLFLILIVCALIFVFIKKSFSTLMFVAGLAVLQFIDINIFGFSQNNSTMNPEEYFNRPADLVRTLKEDGATELFRMNARQNSVMLMDRNQGMVDRIFMMEGYSPLVLQRVYPPGKDWNSVQEMMNVKYRIVVDEHKQTMSMGRSTDYVPRVYGVYDGRIIKDDAQQKAFMQSDEFNPARSVVLEDDVPFAPDTADPAAWNVKVNSYNLNSILVKCSTPHNGYLCFSEIYYPGWHAYVDGAEQPVYRANWNLRAVPIVAGSHTLEMKYEPASFYRGMWITLSTFLLSIIGHVFSLKQRKYHKNDGETI